ncbi:MAG: esterase, partial [Micromonosporaceae bacterium]|nr:esterase [Micromonosporaceae bacterium]
MGFVAASATTQPVSATEGTAETTPWITVADGFASFAVPTSDVQSTMGNVAGVVVEANFGPSFSLSELGLSRSDRAWTSVIGPLQPGLYYYRFRGDDTKIMKDPTNPTAVTSDPTWSTFLVPGDSTRLLANVPQGQGGAVETVTYAGEVATQQRSAAVWTPPGYDARRKKPYPVLYLQPGEGAASTDWLELGRARQILDNLAVQRRLEPMVVVIGNAGTGPDGRGELEKIIATTRRNFNVAHDPKRQALAGTSAAGAQALSTVLTHPGKFGYVGSFAGVPSDEGLRLNARAINAGTELLRLYTGNATDPAYNPTCRFMRTLDRASVEYDFDGVNPDAGHNWNAWQENLADFAPRLFRTAPDHRPSPGHAPLRHEFELPAAGTAPTPWLAKDANGNTFATVETSTEYATAQHVTLWGNWAPGGSWVNVHMTSDGDRWRATVGPLKPWFYYYKFIVDLASKKDPSNPTSITTEPTWSTFLVPGERSRLLADAPAGRGGSVETLTYDSAVAGGKRTANVWLPPGYDAKRATPYPVFYLQHGGGQNSTDWLEMGRAKQILDNEFLDGELVPMVVVMGNGNVSDYPKELLENLGPATSARYNISSDPAQRAIAGLSMGGFQTFAVLKQYPGAFGYVASFSAGIGTPTAGNDPTGLDPVAINNGTKLLRVYTTAPSRLTYDCFASFCHESEQGEDAVDSS